MTKRKILVLTSTFPRWKNDSTPPFVFELEKRLASNFDVHVLAPHFTGAKKYEKIADLKIHRFQYFWPTGWQKLCYEGGILPNLKKNKLLYIQAVCLIFFELVSAIRLALRGKIDFIHAHWTIPSGLVAVIMKKLLKIPVLITAHAGDVFTNNQIIQSLNNYIVKNADLVTVNSQATEQALSKYIKSPHDLTIIPMGVDTNKFKPQKIMKKTGNKLLFVGRLAEKKGVAYLIEALPQIIKKVPKTKLLIIGEGPEEARLRNLAHKFDLGKSINFLGKIANNKLSYYYNLADVVITPSIQTKAGDTEGLGVVILEAMACGTPVIASRIGGIPDIIEHDKNGWLVPPKNVSSLVGAITRLLGDQKLGNRLRVNARNRIRRFFDWRVVAGEFRKIYEQI